MAKSLDPDFNDLLTLKEITNDERALRSAQKEIEEQSFFMEEDDIQLFDGPLEELTFLVNVKSEDRPKRLADAKEEIAQHFENCCVSY